MNDGLSFEDLFDAHFLAQLDGFALRALSVQQGGRLAEQRTRARGQGAEFADYKPYSPGDDLRAVDWNTYRRLGRAFVRVFEERQDLPVHLMIDVSHSMFAEQPPRIHAASRVAMALAAIALRQHDSIAVMPFSDEVPTPARSVSGKSSLVRVGRSLAALRASGRTSLTTALNKVAAQRSRRGILVVVSDFFDDAGLEQVLDAITRITHRVLLVQLVKPYDADPRMLPSLTGDVVLDDGETPGGVAVTVTPSMIERYEAVYRAFAGRLTEFAQQRGIGLARIDVDEPVLPQLGVLFANGSLTL